MPKYTIDSKTSKLVVTARSSVHNTDIDWVGITGTIDAESGGDSGAMAASIDVDMSTADAGDWLKNRKMRKELQLDKHASAHFDLESVEDLSENGSAMQATLRGTLSWRGKSIAVTATGEGTLLPGSLVATAQFDIDMTQLGITPPKVLMLKIEDVVNCRIELRATATS